MMLIYQVAELRQRIMFLENERRLMLDTINGIGERQLQLLERVRLLYIALHSRNIELPDPRIDPTIYGSVSPANEHSNTVTK